MASNEPLPAYNDMVALGKATSGKAPQKKSRGGSIRLLKEDVGEELDRRAGAPKEPAAKRMVIYSGNFVISHTHAAAAVKQAVAIGKRLGGYEQRVTNTEVVLRIPVDRFQEAVAAVAKLGDVVEKVIEGRDVTEQYFDYATRLESLDTAHRRYLALYAKATKVEQMTLIQREIDKIEAEMNRLKGKLKVLKSLAALSTLRVRFVAPRVKPRPPVSTALPIPWLRELGFD